MPRPADDGWVSTGGRERDWGWVISWLSKPEAQGQHGNPPPACRRSAIPH
jgi:hypothetical protein